MRPLSVLFLVACGVGTETPTDALSGACILAATHGDCPSCSDGPVTCSYDTVSVTVNSCGDCQARAELYTTLCAAEENDLADTIEQLSTCEPILCAVEYRCGCTPECRSSTDTSVVDCATTCTTPTAEPPGECAWAGDGCDWQ